MSDKEQPDLNNVEGQFEVIRRRFLESITFVLTFLVIFGLPVSIMRMEQTGWLTAHYIHLIITPVILLTYLLRRRINSLWLAVICLMVLLVLSVTGLMQYGALSAGGFFAMLAVFVATILGFRVGVSVALFCIASMFGIGYLWHLGILQLASSVESYFLALSFWLGQIVVLAVGSGLFVISARGFFDQMNELMAQIEQQKQKIEFLANHDALTNLPTVRLASDRLDNAIKSARRDGHQVALLFLDLDGFKSVNDSYGHDVGDHVLKTVAQRTTDVIREVDTACRIGGDEFLVILANCQNRDKAEEVSCRLIEAIKAPIVYDKHSLSIGISVGISMYPEHGHDLKTLKNLADIAMYKAKRKRATKFCFAKNEATNDV